MTNEDESLGRLLEATPLTLHEKEVPRKEYVCAASRLSPERLMDNIVVGSVGG